jgi:hypothetical protein
MRGPEQFVDTLDRMSPCEQKGLVARMAMCKECVRTALSLVEHRYAEGHSLVTAARAAEQAMVVFWTEAIQAEVDTKPCQAPLPTSSEELNG